MRSGFYLFFKKSVSRRKGRIVIAALSVTLSVAMVSGIIGMTAGVGAKLGEELRAYGANIIVSPREGNYLAQDVAEKVSRIDSVRGVSGQIFGTSVFRGQPIEIIGLDIAKLKDRGWRLQGKWPQNNGEILAGTDLRSQFKIDIGAKMHLPGGDIGGDFVITGFIERGGTEDSALILDMPDAWTVTGADRQFSAVLVRAEAGRLDEVVQQIRRMIPQAEAKTFRQIAVAEESLLRKIQLLMVIVTVVILCAAVISVAATMGANVLERREEIGLMKALGATKAQINIFYRAEAILTGLTGGVAGFISGYFFTQAVSKGAFGSYVPVPFYIFFISLLFGLVISVTASYLPVRNALKYNPAVILRGE